MDPKVVTFLELAAGQQRYARKETGQRILQRKAEDDARLSAARELLGLASDAGGDEK